MPQYSDLIRIEGEYNYSANIQFDMENDRKLLRFIPNETTVELLKGYFLDITRSNPEHHARILYGSYGTGKSHFLTVLSMLLGKVYTDGLAYKSFLSRIDGYDHNLAMDINGFVNDSSRKPLLIVPIVFDFDDFDRCIYFSLKRKLDLIGKKVSFKTFFGQASSLIDQWKTSKESALRLNEACSKAHVDLAELEELLARFDRKAESKFQKVFAEMTYGVKYIYEVANIADNITQANEAIADDYSGIVFIFDEFGRYIEDNIKTIKVKAVQNLAEFCDHSAENNHIILVSHKEISQYTQRFGKAIANEWKKVEGRYNATPINDKQDQCLSLIRNILPKDEKTWKLFSKRFAKELGRMYSEATDFRGFLIDTGTDTNPFEGGFPLHPISLFALDKLSKRVAQNERTFFTYLASKDDNSLYRFLNSHDLDEFHFVGIDEVFDYFAPSVKSTQSDASYEWYKELQSALSKNHSNSDDNTPEVKILKVIATIGIINDASTLVANKATIQSVIDCPNEVISNAVEGLCERKIIKYSGAYDRYDFFEASIYDVEEMINDESQSVTDEAVISTLNEEFVNFALYPHAYNREYKISRVFVPVFANIQSITKKIFANKFGKYYDGLLVMLLSARDESAQDITHLSSELSRAILFANLETDDLRINVKKYISVKYLESQKAKYNEKDPAFEKELGYFKDELRITISGQIEDWKNCFDSSSIISVNGREQKEVDSFARLSEIASNIMYSSYPDTLIVNNELINKNIISGSIASAKKNVVANIIRGAQASNYYDVQFLSPDYISVRSVLIKNGFATTNENVTMNALSDGCMPQEKVKEALNAFISKGKTEAVSFEELYVTLKEPPYGMRTGYMSLLFSHILMPYKKSLIISSHGTEQELSVELFEEIVRRPQDYSYTIADWDRDQLDYLDSLEQIFADYINATSLSKNRLKAIYDAMMSHYKNVSKFARTTQAYVSENTKQYRKILEKSAANYSTFLFAKLKNIGGNYEKTVELIKQIKTELDDAIQALGRDVAVSICTILNSSPNTPVAKVIADNYEKSWQFKRSKSFDYYTNAFLDLAGKIDRVMDDYSVVLKFSKALTGFELLYWNDSHKDEFVEKLQDVNNKLDAYQDTAELKDKESKITILSSNGDEKSVVFDRNELSSLSQTVRNKIQSTFSNYGLAISYDEKVQILLSLLEGLMEGK